MTDIIQRIDEQIARTMPGQKVPPSAEMSALLVDARIEINRLRAKKRGMYVYNPTTQRIEAPGAEPDDFMTFFKSIAMTDRISTDVLILAAAISSYYGKATQ